MIALRSGSKPPYRISSTGVPTTSPFAAAQKQSAVASFLPNRYLRSILRQSGRRVPGGTGLKKLFGRKGSRMMSKHSTLTR